MDSEPRSPFHGRVGWLLLVVAASLAIVIMFVANNGFFREFDNGKVAIAPPPPGDKPQSLLVTVNFGNGTKRAFKGEGAEGMSAYSALAASGSVGHFAVRTDTSGHVVEIGDVMAREGRTWKLYINGIIANDVPGNIDIAGGDKIEFRYE